VAGVRRGWHAVGMTNTPPDHAEINDIWIDDQGAMKRFDGTTWQPYLDLPDGPPLEPHVVVKREVD
jgi:hypothetical protein